jgi:hypothetical protein
MIDALVVITILANLAKLPVLLLFNQLHIGWVPRRYDFAQWLLVQVADTQRGFRVFDTTAVNDAVRHHLYRCNAHTTASDALWAGLPLLTLIGDTFAGRVAASLLTAVGLPELITTTLEAYEELAVELATNPGKLAAIKSRLARNRMTAPLFDTQLLVGQIEAAYTAMYARYQANLPPEHMDVAIGSKERPSS